MTEIEPAGRPPTVREGDAGGAPAVEREGRHSGRPPTQRESGSGGRPPTQREGVPGGVDSGDWVPIPGSLQGNYRYLTSLDSGGEANLYVVEERKSGRELLLKLYNKGIVLNETALRSIKGISEAHGSNAHVVTLVAWGVAAETQQWFEVQEYLHAGDLSRLVASNGLQHEGRHRLAPGGDFLKDVIAELQQAIAAFHSAGLSHHDIKPANILVRSTTPLDLVLADFGLSIASDRTVFLSRRMGTIAYDSPESLGAGQGGPKRDYWALGMTIAELAGGRHPFSQPSDPSMLLADQTIRSHLYARRPIDLSAVDDGRERRLCEGLTRYEEANRWGAKQVEAWLKGADPEVVPDDHRGADPGAAGTGVAFAGAVRSNRAALAAAMSDDWRAAVASLGTVVKRIEFLDAISTALGSAGLDGVEAAWAANPPGVDRAVIDVIVALDPAGAAPAVKGYIVAVDSLASVARSVASGDRKATETVDALYDQNCLAAVAVLPGQGELADLNRRWHQTVRRFDQLCADAETHGVAISNDTSTIRAILLGGLAEPDFARTIVKDRNVTLKKAKDATKHDWFRPLARAGADDLAAVLAARVLAERAATIAREAQARDDLARRESLSSSVAPVRSWLSWTIAANVLVAVGLLAAVLQETKLSEVAAESDLDDWIGVLLTWAPRWWVWGLASAIAIVARRAVKHTTEPAMVRAAQFAAVASTLTVPLLVPFGVRRAFVTRRARTNAGPSRLREWAVAGAVAIVLILVGLVAEEQFAAFQKLFDVWPEEAQSWYLQNWPNWLYPAELNERFASLLAIGLAVVGVGFAGAWASYSRPRSLGVRGALVVGALGGTVASVSVLPVLLTGAGVVLIGILTIGILWLLISMFSTR